MVIRDENKMAIYRLKEVTNKNSQIGSNIK